MLAVGLLVSIAVGLVGTSLLSVAFDTGYIERSTSIDVVSDLGGAQQLNVTSEMEEGTTNCLVKVTNHLARTVTVNVSLRANSEGLGTLQRKSDILGLEKGDTLEFTLDNGASETINMDVNAGTAGNTTYFDVNATATDSDGNNLYVVLENRSAPIKTTAGTTCT